VGLFGRRKRDREEPEFADDYDDVDDYDEVDGEVGGDLFDDAGPYDVDDAPEDGVQRRDYGALRLAVPQLTGFDANLNPDGSASEIYLFTEFCALSVAVYAAPRSSELWREEWCGDLAKDIRGKGGNVRSVAGAWGQELVVTYPREVIHFVGVDGPRWMLRGVVSSPHERMENAAAALYDLIRGAVVVRGEIPMPVGMPLPLRLSPEEAAHVAARHNA
jgi:Protein of unknown function (DUF3710)